MVDSKASTHAFFHNIVRALKTNLKAGLVLQGFALAIGLSYFYWPAAQSTFTFFGELKQTYGVFYAILSTSIFGGLAPVLVMCYTGKIRNDIPRQILFYCVLWAFMGWVINSFYEWQIVLFGDSADIITVFKKTAFDQFVFSSLITCPFLTLVYLWREQSFNWTRTKLHLNRRLITEKIPTTIITNWLIWIPAVSLIYMMPANLQIPLFNLVLCFFVLLLTMLNMDEKT